MRILVADDQEFMRKSICSVLLARGAVEICGEASDGIDAVEKTRELLPDLVVLDITMPNLNGFDAARKIKEFSPQTPILIVSIHNTKQLIEEAKRLGLNGYVSKSEAGTDLGKALDAIAGNSTFFPTF